MLDRGNGHKNINPFDMTRPEHYEQWFPEDNNSNIDKMYSMPGIEDMAGVFIRGNFKDEDALNSHVLLCAIHQDVGNTFHQEMLRNKIAGQAGIKGERTLYALFAGIGILASDMLRVLKGFPKLKKGEEDRLIRNSDFQKQPQQYNTIEGVQR